MTINLRPEARPLNWNDLNEAQQGAFRKLVRLINESIPEGTTSRPASTGVRRAVDEWLTYDRSNRTAFVTGMRGSGKTTVLLSLMQACSSGVTEDELATFGVSLRKDVEVLRKRVVWLEPIDMEPAPKNLHILAAILVRVERLVDYAGVNASTSFSSEVRHEDYPPSTDIYSVLMDLRRLQTMVAVGWDGHSGDRRGGDADADAQDILRTERSRLSLNPSLSTVLDDIATRVLRQSSDVVNPIFLLPIDDVDLNPPLCLPLLRLLRMISVPRLFTLMLGDLNVAEVVLNLKFSSDISAIGKDARELDVSTEPGKVAETAGEIASHAFRKLIPPHQRVQLTHYSRAGGMEFRPIDAPKNEQMKDLLKQVPLQFEDRGPGLGAHRVIREYNLGTLFHFMAAPPLFLLGQTTVQEMSMLDLSEAPYTGIDIVSASPRRLADRWLALKEIVDTIPSRAQAIRDTLTSDELRTDTDFDAAQAQAETEARNRVVRHFVSEVRELLRADPALTQDERASVPSMLSQTDPGAWDVGRLPLKFHALTGIADSQNVDVKIAPSGRDYQCDVELKRGLGWSARIEYDQDDWQVLTPDTVAMVVTVHDLIALVPGFLRPVRLQQFLFDENVWALTTWSVGGEHDVKLRWPAPPFRSIWGFDQFLAAWNDYARDPATADASAYAWLSIGMSVLENREPLVLTGVAPTKKDWTNLGDALFGSTTEPSRIQDTSSGRDWLIEVIAMIMPEYGLSPDVGKAIGSHSGAKAFVNRYRPFIRRERIRALSELAEAGFQQLVDAIRKETYGVNSLLGIGAQHFIEFDASFWEDPDEE